MIDIIGTSAPGQLYGELHAHSAFSTEIRHGGKSPGELAEIAEARRLNFLALTDHNDISGSLEAKDHAKRKGLKLDVIPASEISTANGHVVALYIKENIEAGLTAEETVHRIHEQGGLAIAPHPFYQKIRSSLGRAGVMGVVDCADRLVYWDGFEVYNAGAGDYARGFPNEQATGFYNANQGVLGAPIGSTDSHGSFIGRAVTTYSGSLKQAIKDAKTGVLILDKNEMKTGLDLLIDQFGLTPPTRRRQLKQKLAVVAVCADPNQKIDTAFLSPQEKLLFDILREERKPGWVASRLALKLAYSDMTGLPAELFSCITIGNRPDGSRRSGPPCITTNPHFYYSLSHEDLMAVGAVSVKPIGVDIEKTVPKRERILRRISEPGDLVCEDASLGRDELSARRWCLYEAVAKGTQIGISMRNLKIPVTLISRDAYTARAVYNNEEHSSWQAEVSQRDGYYLAVAHQLGVGHKVQVSWY